MWHVRDRRQQVLRSVRMPFTTSSLNFHKPGHVAASSYNLTNEWFVTRPGRKSSQEAQNVAFISLPEVSFTLLDVPTMSFFV